LQEEAKLEPSTNQQLCMLGNPADDGETPNVENVNTNVTASDHHGDFTDSADAGQKVCPF